MELSIVGILGSVAVGLVLFLIAYFVCGFKEVEGKTLYIIYGSFAVVTIGFSLFGVFLGRTELIKGDFSQKKYL